MGYSIIVFLVLIALTILFITLLPQLIGFLILAWIIATVVRVIREVRHGGSKSYEQRTYQDPYQENQNGRTYTNSKNQNNSGDVIDVEYTTRDITDEDKK